MNLQFMMLSVAQHSVGTINVGVRGEVKKVVTMNVTYEGATAKKYVRKQCYIERDYIGQLMQTSGELDYWLHSEHIESQDDYFYTDCGSLVFPMIVKTTRRPSTLSTTTKRSNLTTAQNITVYSAASPTKPAKPEIKL